MFFQDQDIPAWYEKVFSAELYTYIGTVVGTTKIVRSALGNIKGKWALILTVAIGLIVGDLQIGIIGAQGHLVGLGAGLGGGLAAAGVFKAAKLLGKHVVKIDKQ